ncbi:hypothetical protein [Borreliella garinii]|uniref:hypothetical protein n=1 Tax=Borreliella garinii TaxID=29519 RepID=UPI00042766E4|nr:hypothetical protein [Borreliella garinii]
MAKNKNLGFIKIKNSSSKRTAQLYSSVICNAAKIFLFIFIKIKNTDLMDQNTNT